MTVHSVEKPCDCGNMGGTGLRRQLHRIANDENRTIFVDGDSTHRGYFGWGSPRWMRMPHTATAARSASGGSAAAAAAAAAATAAATAQTAEHGVGHPL